MGAGDTEPTGKDGGMSLEKLKAVLRGLDEEYCAAISDPTNPRSMVTDDIELADWIAERLWEKRGEWMEGGDDGEAV